MRHVDTGNSNPRETFQHELKEYKIPYIAFFQVNQEENN